MPKPKCDCTTPLHWDITYVSKSPSKSSNPADDEIIAIEIRCSKHKVNWWWSIGVPRA